MEEIQQTGNIAQKINLFTEALNEILGKLSGNDKRIAEIAIQGIEAEAQRVSYLESVVGVAYQISGIRAEQ